MKKYSQHIELINNYLNNLLSNEARIDFESKLLNDIEFNTLYEEQIVFVNGLKRVQIKADIQKGKRSYQTEKWLKISGISILAIGALVMLYTLVFNTSETDSTQNNDNSNIIISDSISAKDSKTKIIGVISNTKIDTSKTEPQVDVNKPKTKAHEIHGSLISKKTDVTKRAQIIRINVEKDTTIKCKEGTILKIANGSFINPNTKKMITGIIDLKVTEYYKLSDMLLANLSTVSNGKELETGGMLYVEAIQGDTNLELKESSSIEISFPTKNKKNGMQLFSGDWKNENVNWNLQEDDTVDNIENLEHNVEVPFSVVEQVPMFSGCENDDDEISKKCTIDAISKFISRNYNTDVGLGLGLTGKQRIVSIFKIDQEGNIGFIRSRAAHPRLSQEADRVIALLPKMRPGMQRGMPVTVPYSLPIIFEIGSDELTGQISKAVVSDTALVINPNNFRTIEMDTVYSSVRGVVETIREVMHDKDFEVDSSFMNKWQQYKKQKLIRRQGVNKNKRYILRKSLFEMENTRFKVLEDDSVTRGGHVIRVPWDETKIPTTTRLFSLVPKQQFYAGSETITAEEFESRIDDLSDTTISSDDVNYYVLKASNLGWINCDRFINGRTKRITYKFKMKNSDGAKINMVFKSRNSILPSWNTNDVYDFQTVGANEDVTLVAIKRKEGKLFYDTVETKTEANPKVSFDFKEVSLQELKKEIEKLNNNFN